ncbi:MAG: MmcQ/YjbR family DNA-binding protein, partial [Acidimicrobiales bacterium]
GSRSIGLGVAARASARRRDSDLYGLSQGMEPALLALDVPLSTDDDGAMAKRVDRAQVAKWARSLPAVVEEFPFGPQAAVFKIGGKMFALVPTRQHSVTVKVDPDDGVALRSQFAAVTAGYHMNKRHWITIDLASDDQLVPVEDLLEESYLLVVMSLTKKLRTQLGLLADELLD